MLAVLDEDDEDDDATTSELEPGGGARAPTEEKGEGADDGTPEVETTDHAMLEEGVEDSGDIITEEVDEIDDLRDALS